MASVFTCPEENFDCHSLLLLPQRRAAASCSFRKGLTACLGYGKNELRNRILATPAAGFKVRDPGRPARRAGPRRGSSVTSALDRRGPSSLPAERAEVACRDSRSPCPIPTLSPDTFRFEKSGRRLMSTCRRRDVEEAACLHMQITERAACPHRPRHLDLGEAMVRLSGTRDPQTARAIRTAAWRGRFRKVR